MCTDDLLSNAYGYYKSSILLIGGEEFDSSYTGHTEFKVPNTDHFIQMDTSMYNKSHVKK